VTYKGNPYNISKQYDFLGSPYTSMCLCVQGDNADCMFFVEDGEIRIAMRQSVGTSRCLALSNNTMLLF